MIETSNFSMMMISHFSIVLAPNAIAKWIEKVKLTLLRRVNHCEFIIQTNHSEVVCQSWHTLVFTFYFLFLRFVLLLPALLRLFSQNFQWLELAWIFNDLHAVILIILGVSHIWALSLLTCGSPFSFYHFDFNINKIIKIIAFNS